MGLLGNQVILAGFFRGGVDFDPGPGIVQGLGSNAFAVSLSTGGQFQWAALTEGGPGIASIWAMDTDERYAYIGGEFYLTRQFGPFTLEPVNDLSPRDGYDAFMAKIDAGGNFVWASAIASQEWDRVSGIAGDPRGNAVGVGFINHVADFDPGPGELLLGDGGLKPFVVKLGGTGQLEWAGIFETFGSSRDVAIGPDGGPVVVGNFNASSANDFDPGPGVEELRGTSTEGFIVKLARNGKFLWAGNVGSASLDVARRAHITGPGHLFVGGEIAGDADLDPGPGVEETPAPGRESDVFLLKIRPFLAPPD